MGRGGKKMFPIEPENWPHYDVVAIRKSSDKSKQLKKELVVGDKKLLSDEIWVIPCASEPSLPIDVALTLLHDHIRKQNPDLITADLENDVELILGWHGNTMTHCKEERDIIFILSVGCMRDPPRVSRRDK